MDMYEPEADPATQVARALSAVRAAPGDQFEALAAIARQLTGAPMAALNFIEGDRQWNKAACGGTVPEMARSHSICQHTVAADAPLIVPDLAGDPRFAGLPQVRDGMRFYAGVPLHLTGPAREAQPLGALCILDTEPRTITPDVLAALQQLAGLAESLIEAQLALQRAVDLAATADRQNRSLQRQERLFTHAERMAMIGWWRLDVRQQAVEWSAGIHRIHELPVGAPLPLDAALDFYPPHARATVSETLARAIETGEDFDMEIDMITAAGRLRRVRSQGEVEAENGVPVAITGVYQDITERWQLEQQLRRSARIDALTSLANRAGFDAALEQAVTDARATGASCTLVLIDLDRFKAINDQHGHNAGDDVLRAVGARLRAPAFRPGHAARLGGDEFALLFTDSAMSAKIDALVVQLLADLRVPIRCHDVELPCSATIGYAAFADCGGTMRDLVHCADLALYQAKRSGRGTAARHQACGVQERRQAG